MDDLFAHRKEPGLLDQLVAVGQATLSENPHDFEAAWRLARAYCWMSQTVTDRSAITSAAAAGTRHAEVALRLDPSRVEGHFFYGFAVGIYATNVGVSEALFKGLSSKFKTAMRRAYDINKDFEDGAPIIALGRYYSQVPWPLRDLDQSKAYLEEAVRMHPSALFGRVYLAETYYALGDVDAARRQLEAVIQADPSTAEWQEPIRLARENLTRWFDASQFASAGNPPPRP